MSTAQSGPATEPQAAVRAIDDPVRLGRAARIVRAALQRQGVNLADLGVSPGAT